MFVGVQGFPNLIGYFFNLIGHVNLIGQMPEHSRCLMFGLAAVASSQTIQALTGAIAWVCNIVEIRSYEIRNKIGHIELKRTPIADCLLFGC